MALGNAGICRRAMTIDASLRLNRCEADFCVLVGDGVTVDVAQHVGTAARWLQAAEAAAPYRF